MNKSWRCYLTFGFLLVVGLPEISTTALAQPAKKKLMINLRVYNYAQVPEKILSEAEKEVREVLRKIGVETCWLHVPQSSGKNQLEFLCRRPKNSSGLDLNISMPPRSTVKTMVEHLGRQDDVFGLSPRSKDKPGHLAYVFYHRVEEFLRAQNLHEHKARILGLAIAHEIGHLLLPSNAHSRKGIMRAVWERQDFRFAIRGNLGFTPKQAELIRSEVLRRSTSNPEVP